MARKSWIDPETNEIRIEGYVKKLKPFSQAFADGVIDEHEISDEQARLIDLMMAVEEKLDDQTHALVTKLIVELSAFNIMQLSYQLQQEQAKLFRQN